MDNAGENLLLQERAESKDWKLGLVYKYMARDTPQQNALAEIGFTKIGGRAKAMMKRAFTPDKVRHLVMPKALKVATKLDRYQKPMAVEVREGVDIEGITEEPEEEEHELFKDSQEELVLAYNIMKNAQIGSIKWGHRTEYLPAPHTVTHVYGNNTLQLRHETPSGGAKYQTWNLWQVKPYKD
jgi:hypothetical protein